MDYGSLVKLAIGFVAITVLAQDPSEMLERARYKILSELPSQSQYSCVETIDRSCFSRKNYNPLSSTPSCEILSVDRKKGRTKLKLDSTDRLRIAVALNGGREIFSWTGPGGFSDSVE